MTPEIQTADTVVHKPNVNIQGGSPDAVYGIGMVGAWVYYISRASNFREGVIGFFKGLVWPAFVVYDLLRFLNGESDEPTPGE
jgi:hypothetical protein